MEKINIDSVPPPFREFLGDVPQEISATNVGGIAGQARNDSNLARNDNRTNDMSDLLFLAAILMMCDD